MRNPRSFSPACSPAALAAAVLLLGPATASALTNLRWVQPADSATVDEFRVYVGPSTAAGDRVYAGLPPSDGAGVYTADVQIDEIDQGIPVYVWVTAANEFGESTAFNANFYPGGCNPLADSDCDGIPDDGAPGAFPCATGESSGCDDNCPYTANPGQQDTAGIGAGSLPDGIGDACQCGDVSGDGQVTNADGAIIMRALMIPPLAAMTRPELCDVGGSLDCTNADAVIVVRALMVPALATIVQQCEPALPSP